MKRRQGKRYKGSQHDPSCVFRALAPLSSETYCLPSMIKPDITQHARTSANLAAAGGKTIPEYLEGAFPHKHTSDAVAVASIPTSACVPDPGDGATAAAPEKLKTFDEEVLGYPLEGPPEVPFYIKFKGKGKGRPVMYDFDRSSVAQVYGESPPCLISPLSFLETNNL